MNRPLSTVIRDYGLFYEVSGDFGDKFCVHMSWNGLITVYQVAGEVMEEIWQYASMAELVKHNPGFSILSPTVLSEKYLLDHGMSKIGVDALNKSV